MKKPSLLRPARAIIETSQLQLVDPCADQAAQGQMGRSGDVGPAQLKKRFSGRGRPRFSRSVLPSYSRRNKPRRCSSGMTRVDEVVEAARHIREHHVEPVAAVGKQPFLHLIGDRRRPFRQTRDRRNCRQSERAAGRSDFAPAPARRSARARSCWRWSPGFPAAGRRDQSRMRRSPSAIDSDARPLSGWTRLSSSARFRFASSTGFADDDERAWQDFQMIGRAA